LNNSTDSLGSIRTAINSGNGSVSNIDI